MFASLFRAEGMDRSPWGSFFFEPVSRMTAAGVRVTAASAMGLPSVYACIRVKAESFAVLPFRMYRPKVGGGRTRVTDHWLYRLFAKRPNRFQTPYEWREMLQGHLSLRGNAFCQINPDGAGGIDELLPLHPDRMRAELLDNGSYRYVYSDQSGRTIYYRRDEIWHLRGLSSDGIMGISPIELAREAIAEGLSMQAYSNRFFKNDAKPGGWLEFPGKFADKAAKSTFRESWQEMQGGANRGKVAVLEQGMKYHELTLNNKDAQFIESRAAKTTEIARIWRIPPHKIGDLSKSAFSNIEQQAIEFWQDCMMPDAARWESSIGYFLLGADSDLEVDFDMRRMMRADSAARGTYYQSGIQGGWLTRNEAREDDGRDPMDGLDKPLVPLNMVEAGQAPPPGAKPAAPKAPTDEPADGEATNDARLVAIAIAAADRLARKEEVMLRAASGTDWREKVAAAYEKHAAFVAAALNVSKEQADAYCLAQAESIAENGEAWNITEMTDLARCRLERLALKGTL